MELFSPEGTTVSFRPEIKGYSESLSIKKDLFHIFPKEMDRIIIQHGNVLGADCYNRVMYTLPGYINGRGGIYSIKINTNGIISHREFRVFEKANRLW